MTHEEKIKEAVNELDDARENVLQICLEVVNQGNEKNAMNMIRDAVREWKDAGERFHKFLRVPDDITTEMKAK